MINLLRGIAVTLAAATFAYPAVAQNAPPPRMTGAVTAIDGRDLSVSVGDGVIAKGRLNEDWGVIQASRLDAAKIPPGSFVGAGAAKLPDGSLRGVRIVVFPEQLRGQGEGARPWADVPNGQMTNAAVT